MKIALAQLQWESGNIKANIKKHLDYIQKAAAAKADFIVFPELSLTNYEPHLARELAFKQNDSKLTIFKDYSTKYNLAIGLGFPLKVDNKVHIAMAVFKPESDIEFYFKQFLHKDEHPFFHPKKLTL